MHWVGSAIVSPCAEHTGFLWSTHRRQGCRRLLLSPIMPLRSSHCTVGARGGPDEICAASVQARWTRTPCAKGLVV